MNVLIIDTDISSSLELEKALREKGALVKSVANGDMALDLIEKITFDFILMDTQTHSLGGRMLCARLHREAPTSRIIVLTSSPSQMEFLGYREEGCYGYFAKPVSVDLLVSSIVTS